MDRSRTKLVCTIGPATADRIGELVAAGMDVARINFSHGTPDEHKAYVHAVRAAAHSARRSVAVMADLPGPKIRLGEIEGGEVTLQTGSSFILRSDPADEPKPAEVADAPAATEATSEVAETTETSDVPPAVEGVATADLTEDAELNRHRRINRHRRNSRND